MKITKTLLEQIIREEVQRALQESPEPRFLTRMAKDMPVRSVGPPVDDPGTLSPEEGMKELLSYTCFQLEEVMRQHEDGEQQLSEKVLSHLSATMQKKGC